MVKACIYCKCQLNDDSVFDVCQRCGHGVWGENMYNTILENMSQAKEAGDLYQGSVTSPIKEKPKLIPFTSQSKPEPQQMHQKPPKIIEEIKPLDFPLIPEEPIIEPATPLVMEETPIAQQGIYRSPDETLSPNQETKLSPPEDPQLISDTGDILF